MALKSPSFLLISAVMAASALLGGSAALSSRLVTPTLDTSSDAISPYLHTDEGPVVEAPAPMPGLTFLDTKDPKVIELAEFAIDEHNKEANDELKFAGIFETIYKNREGGSSYRLVIAATDNTAGLNAYDAKILVERGDKKLVAFKECY